MSLIKALMAQFGKSVTAANNFTLDASANNGTMRLARGNAGATTQDVLLVAADGKVDAPQGAKSAGSDVMRILHIPAKTAAGNNFVEFSPADGSGIPAWAKEITVTLQGVSTNGTSIVQLQLGTAVGIETTGYAGSVDSLTPTGNAAALHTGGVALSRTGTAAAVAVKNGDARLSLLGSNIWTASAVIGQSDTAVVSLTGSAKALAGVLDRIRITTVNGTDTFDAGSIGIIVKG